MRIRPHFSLAGVVGALLVVQSSAALSGEFQIGIYGGSALTFDSDVALERPGGTNLTFKDVSFDGNSFTVPIYFGVRMSYWFGRSDEWGVMLDYTHTKVEANLDQNVEVHGTRAGTPVSAEEPLSGTFGELSFSHGHNLLTLNGMRRWLVLDRVRPYVGVGVGVAIPHVEVIVDGVTTNEFQLTGPAVQGLVGLSVDLIPHLSLFGEYKLSYVMIDGDLDGGGSIDIDPITNHFVFGISVNYGF